MRPMSGYEIKRYLEITQSDLWAGILPGSIYHALKQLTKEGLVELTSMQQTGNRARSIYSITGPGQAELQAILREVWSTASPVFPAKLYCALSFAEFLPREELLQAIDLQIAGLEQTLVAWDAGAEAKRAAMGGLPPMVAASLQNGRDHLLIDLKFLRYLRETLPTMPNQHYSLPVAEDDDER